MVSRIFVLGGTRSGKSRYARERALALGGERVSFIATARSGDPELDARIAAHRADRPATWETIESDWDLADAIARAAEANLLLIDSLTLWLSSALEQERSVRELWQDACDALLLRTADVIIVSDEVGLGIVPMSAAARAFRDELGWIHQSAAAWADHVVLLVAGIPVPVKGAA